MTLEQALREIELLKNENSQLKSRIVELEQITPAGRRTHDEKWQAKYDLWVKLYEDGYSLVEITKQADISRRTFYRYKEHYENEHNIKPKDAIE